MLCVTINNIKYNLHQVTLFLHCIGEMLSYVIWESPPLVGYLNPRPWTPGAVILESPGCLGGSLFQLPEVNYVSWLFAAKEIAGLLCDRLKVKRCALISRPQHDKPLRILILPLHGLDDKWQPRVASIEEYNATDPGYCTSKNGPRWDDVSLTEMQTKIRGDDKPPDLTLLGDNVSDPGLFARIIRGEEQHWRVWEDERHVAFLTPFPNSPGFTVLVPRRPLTSDIFKLQPHDYRDLILAAKTVSQALTKGLGAWGVGLIFEGLEINHAHAKLIPLLSSRGTANEPQFYPTYPGYVTSEDGPNASTESLTSIYNLLVCKAVM
nr:HIT family protein [Megalocytivirus FD201807]